MSWRAVVLAAGKGTRMRSEKAKVLHSLKGRSLLDHLLDTAARLSIEESIVVVGHQHEEVRAQHERRGVRFVLQDPQRGTGHAVQQALPHLRGHDGDTLILYGDVPLLRRSTLLELMEEHRLSENAATVLTAEVRDPSGYGRIIRDERGSMLGITEDRDLAPEQRSIREINSGIYAYRTEDLLPALVGLRDENDQGEIYLTDTIERLRAMGRSVGTYLLADPEEISGINTPEQLAAAEAILDCRGREGTEDCHVCARIDRADPRLQILVEREHALLVVAERPYNAGQLRVYPRRHVLRHAALTGEERADLWELASLASELVVQVYQPQGLNLGYTSGRSGVHLGVDLIPRWTGDTNFMPLVAGQTLLPEVPERTAERIREVLKSREGA